MVGNICISSNCARLSVWRWPDVCLELPYNNDMCWILGLESLELISDVFRPIIDTIPIVVTIMGRISNNGGRRSEVKTNNDLW